MENGASEIRLGSYDDAWYMEHNCTTFVTVSQLLMEGGEHFVHQHNI